MLATGLKIPPKPGNRYALNVDGIVCKIPLAGVPLAMFTSNTCWIARGLPPDSVLICRIHACTYLDVFGIPANPMAFRRLFLTPDIFLPAHLPKPLIASIGPCRLNRSAARPFTCFHKAAPASRGNCCKPPSIPSLPFRRPMKSLIFFRSEEHTSELQSRGLLVCRLL